MYCTNCGNEINANAAFCNECGTEIKTKTPKIEPASDGVKKRKAPIFALIVIALIVILVIGITNTIVKRMNNPIYKIIKAAEKTIDQGSFEVKIYEDEYGWESFVSGDIVIDMDEKNFAFDMLSEGYRIVLIDNEYAEIDNDYHEIWTDTIDSDIVDAVFDIYLNTNLTNPAKSDFEEILKAVEVLSDGEFDIEYNKDSKDVIKLGDKIISKYFKNLYDKEWLDECLGYEKDENTYVFEPDWEALLEDLIVFIEENEDDINELIEEVEDVDRDILDYLDFENSDADDLLDFLDDILDEIKEYPDDFPEIHYEVTIEDGLISEIVSIVDFDGDYYEIEIELSSFGEEKLEDYNYNDVIKEYQKFGYDIY